MAIQNPSAVVLFADIVQGTGLFTELGDTWAVDILSGVHSHLSDVTNTHRGRVIKTVGTEMLCVFDTADRAIMAAGDMHLRVRNAGQNADPERREEVGLKDIRLRVGLHEGPVIEEDGDVYGDTVNVAARLMGLAKADQVLASRAATSELSTALKSSTRFFDRVSPRGKSEVLEVHEVLWEVDDMTMAAPVIAVPRPRKRHHVLTLQCGSNEYEVNQDCATLTLGRSDDNDLVFPGGFASRRHAQVEYVRGRFTITDQSANGTYVVPEDGVPVQLRRDQHLLDGTGRIYLGELPETNPTAVIVYNCE